MPIHCWNPPRNTYHGETKGKWHKSPMQPYINIWHYISVTLYSCVSTSPHHIFLHQIYGNAIRNISNPDQFTHILYEQSSVLLHQGTTFKELLSLVFYRKRAVLCQVSLTFTFMYQVSLTFEDADVPHTTSDGQGQYYIRSAWHFADADVPPEYKHLVVKSRAM